MTKVCVAFLTGQIPFTAMLTVQQVSISIDKFCWTWLVFIYSYTNVDSIAVVGVNTGSVLCCCYFLNWHHCCRQSAMQQRSGSNARAGWDSGKTLAGREPDTHTHTHAVTLHGPGAPILAITTMWLNQTQELSLILKPSVGQWEQVSLLNQCQTFKSEIEQEANTFTPIKHIHHDRKRALNEIFRDAIYQPHDTCEGHDSATPSLTPHIPASSVSSHTDTSPWWTKGIGL